MIDLTRTIADPLRYGWKAHYLSLMIHGGYDVPSAIAFAPDEPIENYEVGQENAQLAVRSSGLAEDSATESFAGSFETHLSVMGSQQAREAIQSVRASGEGVTPMGVIVQAMVTSPTISGVAFSCDPVTLDENRVIISWIDGLGDALVSGEVSGHDLAFDVATGKLISGEWPLAKFQLEMVVILVRSLAQKLDRPVDVEWCIGPKSDPVTALQVRPLVLSHPMTVDPGDVQQFEQLPGPVKAHPKMRLRLEAAQLKVPMSGARALVATRKGGMPDIPDFHTSEHSAGRSVVLLLPRHVEGLVIREFTQDCSTDVEFFTRGCQRYSIRQYPGHTDALDTVVSTLAKGLETAPLACVIEQEILHAYATGIIRRASGGYILEMALGHFVPKGYVGTSTFVLDHDLHLTHQTAVEQLKAYHFINGHVVVEEPPYEKLTVSESDLAGIINQLRPMLESRPEAALEFGVLGKPSDLSAYIIDVADSDVGAADLSAETIARGVIAAGTARGPLVDLRGASNHENLNAHLLENIKSGDPEHMKPAVYVASRASVDLLPIVRACPPGSGFVFEQASLLAHLAVVLRERGIAAVVLSSPDVDSLIGSESVLIDSNADVLVRPAVEVHK